MISDTTLKRAKKAVGVISEKLPDGAWQWKLDQGGHPLKSGQGGHEGQGGQPYMSNVTPLTPQAKNKDIQSEIEGQGGHGSDIAVALLKSEFDAVEVSA